MPRHTHPLPRQRHSRAHTRHHYRRVIDRRWKQLKNRQGDRLFYVLRLPGSGWRGGFVHPEEIAYGDYPKGDVWPLVALGRSNLLARNPWTACSCSICQDDGDAASRAQQRRRWRKHVEEELASE